jgi:RNA polymerase sigma-70 factor (ECF subfamily)
MVPPHEIEDIVQETYVRLCQVENIERIDSPKAFMYKTARNLALDYIKRADTKKVDRVESQQMLDDLVNGDNKMVDEMYHSTIIDKEFKHFCDAVRMLPVQCRKVFVLKKVYGNSQKEISEQLGISQSTVEKHISNGLKRCTVYMSNLNATVECDAMKNSSMSKGVAHD